MESMQLHSGAVLGAFPQQLLTAGFAALSLCKPFHGSWRPVFLVFSPFLFHPVLWMTVLMSAEALTEIQPPLTVLFLQFPTVIFIQQFLMFCPVVFRGLFIWLNLIPVPQLLTDFSRSTLSLVAHIIFFFYNILPLKVPQKLCRKISLLLNYLQYQPMWLHRKSTVYFDI